MYVARGMISMGSRDENLWDEAEREEAQTEWEEDILEMESPWELGFSEGEKQADDEGFE